MKILTTGLSTLMHPIVSFESILADKGKRQSYMETAVLLLLVILSRIGSIYWTHAPLASVRPGSANLIVEITKILIPFFTWGMACYGVTSIMDGETTLYETTVSAAYSLTPYLLFTIPMSILSNVMSTSEAGLYSIMFTFMWAWIVFLYFLSLKEMNNYTLGKAIGVFFLVLCTMILIWAIAVLFYVLTNNLWSFLKDLQLELRLLWLGRK
ncbi:MAG TPA: hypothetical protein DDW86_04360 [Clostridiales bacterium]|jgi:hypothetical protein|nr:hypothetical protein [Clostridiales bacterium]